MDGIVIFWYSPQKPLVVVGNIYDDSSISYSMSYL